MSAPFAQIGTKYGMKWYYLSMALFIAALLSYAYIVEANRMKKPKYKTTEVKKAVYNKANHETTLLGKKDRENRRLEILVPGNHIKNFPIGTKIKYRFKKIPKR